MTGIFRILFKEVIVFIIVLYLIKTFKRLILLLFFYLCGLVAADLVFTFCPVLRFTVGRPVM